MTSLPENRKEPAYLRLCRELREAVLAGVYSPGSRLPSKRQLAAERGVSVITAEHALALLADEGYAELRERSGTYALARGEAAPRRASLEEMSLPLSVPEDFPFSALAKIMRRTLAEKGEQILAKSPPQGTAELRGAIRDYLSRSRGVDVPEERIFIGSGAEHFYALLVQLLGRERVFALEEPCYGKIRRVYELGGARCEPLPMGADGIESEALARCTADVLHVTPSRSYPSGVTADAAKRREYVDWARSRGALLIEDDYASELDPPLRRGETLLALLPERVIYLNTFSKTIAPSFRAGYMLLPDPLAALYRERLGFYSCTVPVYEQYVLAEWIRSGEFERTVNRRRRKQNG